MTEEERARFTVQRSQGKKRDENGKREIEILFESFGS